MKKALVFLICFFTILTLAVLIYTIFKDDEKIYEEKKILFRIKDVKSPKQILWYKGELFLVIENHIKKFCLEKRKVEFFAEIEENHILGEYTNELVYIEYENHVIESPEEYATYISIFDLTKGNTLFSREYHETIKPMYIEENFLFLIDNYFNSPNRTYRINLESGDIEKYDVEQIKIEGTESIRILKDNRTFEIPLVNKIQDISIDKEKDRVALIDTQGSIWIYLED